MFIIMDDFPYLCNVEDLARQLRLPASDPSVTAAARRASDRFRGETGWNVTRETQTLVLDPPAGETLLLPVRGVAKVEIVLGGLQIKNFSYSRRTGAVHRHGGWGTALGSIEVTVTSGAEEVPGDIQDAVLEHAAHLHAAGLAGGAQQITQGTRSMTLSGVAAHGVTRRWSDCVERYRVAGQGVI